MDLNVLNKNESFLNCMKKPKFDVAWNSIPTLSVCNRVDYIAKQFIHLEVAQKVHVKSISVKINAFRIIYLWRISKGITGSLFNIP